MYDPAAPEELENPEPDLPPEVEVFLEVPAASPDTEFLGDVTQLYLNEIGANPLLTAEEELSLSRQVRLGNFEARQKMIERNLRLVVNIAKHYLNRGIPLLAACAAGNLGLIHAAQMLRLGEVDLAICGGVSESIHTFGIFAGFKSQNALAHHEDPKKASRPFDKGRNGIVISEGGCIYTLERLDDAVKRGAKIYGEIAGYHVNSDASDYVLPNPGRQAECVRKALANAKLAASDIHIVNTHATSTPQGDIQECEAIRAVFGEGCPDTHINNTKSYIGHCMGAAGALELAGNLPSFDDLVVHPTINVEELDPLCDIPGLVLNTPKKAAKVDAILNNSFGMLGINSTLIVKRFVA